MKLTEIAKVRINFASAICFALGGAWWLSAFYTDVQDFKQQHDEGMRALRADLAEVKGDVKLLLRRAAETASCSKHSVHELKYSQAFEPKENDHAQN